jgi:hypothetical protein
MSYCHTRGARTRSLSKISISRMPSQWPGIERLWVAAGWLLKTASSGPGLTRMYIKTSLIQSSLAYLHSCCIDKRSSAELSEAINSMYKWYWRATKCYAYLSDVPNGPEWEAKWSGSRWFSRGWVISPHHDMLVLKHEDTKLEKLLEFKLC